MLVQGDLNLLDKNSASSGRSHHHQEWDGLANGVEGRGQGPSPESFWKLEAKSSIVAPLALFHIKFFFQVSRAEVVPRPTTVDLLQTQWPRLAEHMGKAHMYKAPKKNWRQQSILVFLFYGLFYTPVHDCPNHNLLILRSGVHLVNVTIIHSFLCILMATGCQTMPT